MPICCKVLKIFHTLYTSTEILHTMFFSHLHNLTPDIKTENRKIIILSTHDVLIEKLQMRVTYMRLKADIWTRGISCFDWIISFIN